ncbi:HAMP domain-containing protein [Archangium violaceum]|uniref:sensor histidine kinase n=1 Tax=Archangium violaceum TaxID=83451 RepID=UPI00193C2B61|nr:ATP-binding protein [Archangium violaceum]QRK11709.1 HAMP domain-containing protein [Archangium violaceum]
MRARILVFAAVAVGLVALLGGTLFALASRGQGGLERLLAIQEQTEFYGRVTDDALGFLHALLQAHGTGGDTRGLLAEQETLAQVGYSRLRALVRQEHLAGSEAEELLRIEQLERAHLHWLRSSEARVREAPAGSEATLLHEALSDFREQVVPSLEKAWALERTDLDAHKLYGQRTLQWGQLLGLFAPFVALTLVFSLAILIYLNIRRALRTLLRGAERIGAGDLHSELPVNGDIDEYDLMAQAINRMAAQLRDSVRERERLAKAEAEASEREMRRYNALLEETVHQRTAQLEEANVRLTDSVKQLQSAQAQLLFTDRLATIGQLAAGVGHEINNPLTFILSNLNYAQQVVTELEAAPTAERRELLEALAEAREGAERVRLIVRDLKMLSHPDDRESGPVDLVKVVRSAAKMAAHEIRDRARLVQQVENVPPVHGNSARLCQVFLNLLINAAHAITPGQVERNEIQLVARVDDSQRVTVEVRDTGCGIPEDKLERVFEPFFTTKPVGEGSGLGLSVCQSIISAYGGKISVESEAGRGTTFRVSLPVHGGEARA